MLTETGERLLEEYGGVIHADTRKQAIADGLQVCVSDLHPNDCRLYKHKIYFTRSLWELVQSAAQNYLSDDPVGLIVWDIVCMSVQSPAKRHPKTDRCYFPVAIQTFHPSECEEDADTPIYWLLAVVGPEDYDDPTPAVTFMSPEEA